MNARQTTGQLGEDLVARYYEADGYCVVDRNWRCREGEIDLIVTRGRIVVFCEVKTRRGNGFGSPAEAVTFEKQRKLRTTALRWMQVHRGRYETRFDVAAVVINGDDAQVELIPNAF